MSGGEVERPQLDVVTGLLDDQRRPLNPGDRWYDYAHFAFTHQAAWDAQEHADFWRGFLRDWPRMGRPAYVERLSVLVEYASNVLELSDTEIAEILCVEPDTVRKRDLVGRGDDLARASSRSCVLGSEKERAIELSPLAPVVFDTATPSPALVRLNLDLEVEEDPTVAAADRRLRERERQMWDSGELQIRGGLIVRNGDEAAAMAATKRLLLQDSTPEEVDEILADAVERGVLPTTAG